VKVMVGGVARAVATLSGRRIVWSPSLEGRAVRSGG
jgi:hypothetical protein